MKCRCALLLLAIAAGLSAPVHAEDAVDYARDIKPLFARKCGLCHGAITHESGLRLDAGKLIVAGGENGPVVVPGDPAGSELLRRITADDGSEMPPEGPRLTAEEVARVREWIKAGARYPSDEVIDDPHAHWSFRPITRPPVPEGSASWPMRNPIDAFIAAGHAQHGLTPNVPAAAHVLLRRVYLDLVGVPPTREELHAFLADDAPDAYERVVDRLLDSPRYGERWGRHWMDVWRYSDWYGRRSVPDVLNSYAQIWRWRDWIVRSLNEDKGYDRMVQEMLAADELSPQDDENIVATGFLVRNFYRWNYHTWMKDNVEHTGKAFLGLTFNCCECHDHKYDPISQREYFQFRAFFEPLEIRHDRVPGEPDPGPYPKYDYGKAYKPINSGLVRVVDETLDAETLLYSGGDERKLVPNEPPIPPGVPAAIPGPEFRLERVDLPVEAWYPGMKAFIRTEERDKVQSQLASAQTRLASVVAETGPVIAEARTALSELKARLRTTAPPADRSKAAAAATATANSEAATAPSRFSGQALRLDAIQGRRVLARGLPELDTLADGWTLTCAVRLLQDGYANLQLSNDLAGGRTNVFVAFRGGEIRTYRPGSTSEIVVGSYRFNEGQAEFRVELTLAPSRDVGRLRIISLSDDALLIDGAEIALNGFRPSGDENRGIYLDAQPGTVAEFDELRITSPEKTLLQWNFESPDFFAEQDAAGSAGWVVSRYSVAPARSRIVSHGSVDPQRQSHVRALLAARSRLQVAEAQAAAARAKLSAAESQLASLEQRIAADDARFVGPSSEVPELIRAAVQSELDAAIAAAQAEHADAQRSVCEARALPENDSGRANTLASAEKRLSAATAALSAARQKLNEPPDDYTPLSPKYPRQSTGRRAALARWISDERNPLTARVAVNHLWQRHFETGIVETTANFGRNGKSPSHPELLDWLAAELMENEWRMKPLHRLVVTSATYRMSSVTVESNHPNRAADRDNTFLWRYPARRVEAEVVRDSLLQVAGVLDGTIGGHEIDHSEGLMRYRRSLYFAHHGESKMEFLALFDGANACDCYQRTSSVRPQQALALSNSSLGLDLARTLAETLQGMATADASGNGKPREKLVPRGENAFVTAAFERILSRPPTGAEREASVAFLAEQRQLLAKAQLSVTSETATATGSVPPSADPAQRAREDFLQALFSHSDFVTVR